MPDADELLMSARQARERTALLQAAESEQFEKTKDAQTAGRLYGLMASEDVQWLLSEFVAPLIAEEDRKLNDLKTPSAERDYAAHRKDMALTIRGLIEAKYKEYLARSNKET